MMIEIRRWMNNFLIVEGDYQNLREAVEKNKINLSGANLSESDLSGADLSESNLFNIKGYVNSHKIFKEIICHQNLNKFSDEEWTMIGKIIIKKLCWTTIKEEFGEDIISVFEKLKNIGYGEWLEYYKRQIYSNSFDKIH